MKKNILIVDDDKRLRELLKDYLNENNLEVYQCEDFLDAKEILSLITFDLIILDRMMPTGDGIDLIEFIKRNSNSPIIMLTAMSEYKNKIDGLKLGADDYLAKPFEPEELYLRIKNLLNFYQNSSNKQIKISFGDFIFDMSLLTLKQNNNIVYLTEGENDLLLKSKIINLNLGTGIGTSVLEIIKIFEEVNKCKLPYKIVGRRDGDVASLVADSRKAIKYLEWTPQKTLEDVCLDSFKWINLN